jgi:hypothetical protein
MTAKKATATPTALPEPENSNLVIDYKSGKPVPVWVRELIETQLAIETEDAKSAGAVGFMSRALVLATMPYKDPKTEVYTRRNGDFTLRIVAGYEGDVPGKGGIPFGIYPRLLMSWVSTEAVRTQSPVIELGESLRTFLRDVLEVRSTSGGKRGSGSRASEQMKRLFGAMITAQYSGAIKSRGFKMRNIQIADDVDMTAEDLDSMDHLDEPESNKPKIWTPQPADTSQLWTPQAAEEAGTWRSTVRLSRRFFEECINSPVPIDLRVYKSLRRSPMAMDVYTWLTYRVSYQTSRARPIPWLSLMNQFGGKINADDLNQSVRDFKKAFLTALQMVEIVYPQVKYKIEDQGFTPLPSPPSIPRSITQRDLFER